MRACEGTELFKKLIERDMEKHREEAFLAFLRRCKEVTKEYDNVDKCQHCKLRFKCYTEG